jgi:chromosome segregation ATPase
MATPPVVYPQPEKSGSSLPLALGGGAIVAMLAANIYLFVQIQDLKKESARTEEGLQAEIDKLVDNTTAVGASNRKHAEQLREEIDAARTQTMSAAERAKVEALAANQETAKRLEAETQQVKQSLSTDITDVKKQANTANTRIEGVSAEVGTVRTQVASTKTDLDKTIAELKSVRGDLSGTNSLVATNGKELAALRRLGERNYIEFKLIKTKQPQRVGDIQLLLKKTDAKKNKFTVEVHADDKTTEKKDRNINEPVQFYVAKAAQPYEIVVNDVKKDQITGYLSTPKDRIPRN